MDTPEPTRSRSRVIGMLGGMSWESSAEYYRLVNEVMRDRLGGLHSARCVLASVDFAVIEELQVAGRWDEAAEILAAEAVKIEAAGADLLLLCTNTMHKVADQIQAAIAIPLLHIADVTAAAVDHAGLSTVGLLGTAFTMEQDFYRDRLAGHGLTVLIPPPADRAQVHRIIYDELCLGVVTGESRELYQGVMARLAGAGAQGVILGCTEIELLIGQQDSPVPVFPTTRLHVEAAVDAALETAARSERAGPMHRFGSPASPCRLCQRQVRAGVTAGCPSGQRELTVNQPALPTGVRIPHLPPPVGKPVHSPADPR